MVTGFRKGEIKDWTLHLESASLVISDGLSCFNMIESADSHHLKIVTDGALPAWNCLVLFGLTQ